MSKQGLSKGSPKSTQTDTSQVPQLQTRPFSDPQTTSASEANITEPQMAASPENKTGFSFEKINLFSSGETPTPPPTINRLLQAKLTVGAANDKYEQEADQVAAQVVKHINSPAMQAPMQRQETEEEELQLKREPGSAPKGWASPKVSDLQMKPLTFQRKANSQSNVLLQMHEALQRQVGADGGAVSDNIESSIERSRGGGQSMGDKIRQPMEQAFGADFSGVKVHTDSTADNLNRSINARAFTTGSDLFFKKGEYNPGSPSGQELLAHELTHVVQQNGSSVQKKSSQPNNNQRQQSPGPDIKRRSLAKPTKVSHSLQRNVIRRDWEPQEGQFRWSKLIEDFRWWYNPSNNAFYYEKEGPTTTMDTSEIATYNGYIAREEPFGFWKDLLNSDPLFKNKIPLHPLAMLDEEAGEAAVAESHQHGLEDDDEAKTSTFASKAKKFLTAINPDPSTNKWRLRAEALGHLTGGLLLGGLALGGVTWAPPFGLALGVGAGAQILIGLSKGVRSFLKAGQDDKWIGALIELEVAASATTKVIAGALTLNPVLIATAIGDLSKFIRGIAVGTGHGNSKVVAVLTAIESVIGVVTNIIGAVAAEGARILSTSAGALVGAVKASRAKAAYRKAKDAQEAEEADASPDATALAT